MQYSYRLIQQGDAPDVLSFKRKTEAESKVKFSEIEKIVFSENGAQKSFITEIGFYSDNIENFIRKNPSTVIVLSEELAESIYDHKGATLVDFLKGLHAPLLVVPNNCESQAELISPRRPLPKSA